MDIRKPISYHWDAQSQTGKVTLLLKIDILKKYAVPPVLDAYHKKVDGTHSLGVVIRSYYGLETFKAACNEIDEFIADVNDASLVDEDPYHGSHILYLLIDHVLNKTNRAKRNDFKTLVFERLAFLRSLMAIDSPSKSTIRIESNSTKISYSTGADALTKGLVHYVTTQLKMQVKRFDTKLYKLLMEGASESALKEAIQLQTEHKIDTAMVGKLARNIIKYLNNETDILRNKNPKSKSSVTVKQGDFIYHILKTFNLYIPGKRGNRTEDDEYDDAIRKLVLRADITEDK
jgi:hypothetical protein